MKLKIEKLVYEGYGLGFNDGKAVFVPFAAPGDLLDVRVVKSHKGFDNAEIVEILEGSACRVEPGCPHFESCGGCHLQHIGYAHQLLWKQLILEEQLCRFAGLENPDILPTIPSPIIWDYRNRIQVHHKKGKTGFLKRESDEIVDVTECPIASPGLNRKLREIREVWPARGNRYEISDDPEETFSQVNPFVNEALKQLVVEWALALTSKNILELYAGSGNLTFELAAIAKGIMAVERDKRAVALGKEFVEKKSGSSKIHFVVSDVGKAFGRSDVRSFGPVDLVLADPPREGMEKSIVQNIAKISPKNILYISCNPSTLARDLKILLNEGYHFVRSQPLDMFPQTYHMESVSLLRFG